MATKKMDRIQPFKQKLTQSGLNVGMIEQVATSYSTKDPIGIEIHQLDWYPYMENWSAAVLDAIGEFFFWGLTQLYKAGTAPSLPNEAGMVDFEVEAYHEKTAVGFKTFQWPRKWIPKEPILVHPASLYLFCGSSGLDSACSIYMTMWFKYVDLSQQEFQDILQTIILQDQL
jgi:hypothetical protein